MTEGSANLPAKAATGIEGLDEILQGGFPRYRSYLIQGQFGTGKTTLALQFLLEGLRRGETTLYFTMSETLDELQQVAQSHGWSLAGIQIHELIPLAIAQVATRQTVFHSADVELDEVTEEILRMLEQVRPDRLVFDSITEIRLLATTPLRYRQQILALRQRLFELHCTTLFLSNDLLEAGDLTLDSLVHGVITLNRMTPEYGKTRRRLEITKLRGMAYTEGYHSFRIQPGGLEVYPRIPMTVPETQEAWQTLSSGIEQLDTLIGGGLETGTACLVTGQAGTGKTSVAMLYAYAAVQRGEHVAIFLFDERLATWHQRAASLGMDLRGAMEQGLVHIEQINTSEIAPGEFSYLVRHMLNKHKVKVLVIDSLSGYINSMPEEKLLLNQMHELLAELGQRGVLTLMILTQHGMMNMSNNEPLDLSYLADTVLLLRHFEAEGAVRQAISVIKKRYAAHERAI
ncbi:MAG: AAA family ATPase, partial [Chloroflexi bacterium]|nr:AAA family ATPase [Chloroflexota bacterium]